MTSCYALSICLQLEIHVTVMRLRKCLCVEAPIYWSALDWYMFPFIRQEAVCVFVLSPSSRPECTNWLLTGPSGGSMDKSWTGTAVAGWSDLDTGKGGGGVGSSRVVWICLQFLRRLSKARPGNQPVVVRRPGYALPPAPHFPAFSCVCVCVCGGGGGGFF